MPFQKGVSGNSQGRPKFSKNKSTAKVKEFFAKVFVENMEQFELDLKELEPKERIKAMFDMAQYLEAKKRAIEITDLAENKPEPILISFIEENGEESKPRIL